MLQVSRLASKFNDPSTVAMSRGERAGRTNCNNKKHQFPKHSHPVDFIKNNTTCPLSGGWNQRLEYIHNNPVEAGIVLSPQLLYSRAINYAGLPENMLQAYSC
jgi:putative transposase